MEQKIKKYWSENIRIQIKDFELQNVSFYGCDACFNYEIRDKETDVLLETDYAIIDNAFMGVDDSEEIYYFLEGKGIDFTEEYDDDFDKLPSDLLKEFEDYKLDYYNDAYHELLFDADDSSMDEFAEKLRHNAGARNKFYIIHGDDVAWISATSDYFGIHLHSDDVKIHEVFNCEEQRYIFEVEGIYFDVGFSCEYSYVSPEFYIYFYERDEDSKEIMTEDHLKYNHYPTCLEGVGEVLFNYTRID